MNHFEYENFPLGDDASLGLPLSHSSNLEDLLAEKNDRVKEREDENKLSPKVAVMKPILRFLQLLCENHNKYMQNLLRDQKGNKTKYNLVSETLILLDVICGSTTGGLGLLGLYINENNVALINQILETLTEYCQVDLLRKGFVYFLDLSELDFFSFPRDLVTKTKFA